MSFATRLKKLRSRDGITQQQLANYLNVTRPTIAGYETKGKEPDYRTLLLIASYFDVSTDYLLTGKEFPDSIKKVRKDTEMGYEDYVILREDVKPAVTQVIERTCRMDTHDVERLLEFSELLLYQPKYNRKYNTKKSKKK
jgi:transcriptional regulator with XRE-family HTH domain